MSTLSKLIDVVMWLAVIFMFTCGAARSAAGDAAGDTMNACVTFGAWLNSNIVPCTLSDAMVFHIFLWIAVGACGLCLVAFCVCMTGTVLGGGGDDYVDCETESPDDACGQSTPAPVVRPSLLPRAPTKVWSPTMYPYGKGGNLPNSRLAGVTDTTAFRAIRGK